MRGTATILLRATLLFRFRDRSCAAASDVPPIGKQLLTAHDLHYPGMRKIILEGLLTLLLCSPSAHAQAASYSIIDRSGTCPTPPRNLQNSPIALSLPKIGTTFKVQVPQGFGGSLRGGSTLMTGIRRMYFNMNYVACAGSTKVTGCGFLLTMPLVTQSTRGTRIDIVIPNSPMLLGAQFYQQVLFVISGPLSGPGGCTLSFQSMYLGPLARGVVGK